MTTCTSDEVISLKEQGNSSLKDGKYEEAILHYTHAIKLDPKNYSLYSNRSLAFLKLQHYSLAHKDATEVIFLNPQWAKGYFRKGEVLCATNHLEEALLFYRLALTLLPGDPVLTEAVKNTSFLLNKDKKVEQQITWVGAGIGLIVGVTIVICDQLLTLRPSISHPLLMALLIISIALLGFVIAKLIRFYTWCQRKGLLEPPVDIMQEKNKKTDKPNSRISTEERPRERYPRLSKKEKKLKMKMQH